MGTHAPVHLVTREHFALLASLHALLVISSTPAPAAVVVSVHECVCVCVCEGGGGAVGSGTRYPELMVNILRLANYCHFM